MRLASLSLLVVLVGCREQAVPPPVPSPEASVLFELTDPAKLDTLKGKRAATPRLRKACYWIETARRGGEAPEAVVDAAQRLNGSYGNERAKAVADSPPKTSTAHLLPSNRRVSVRFTALA